MPPRAQRAELDPLAALGAAGAGDRREPPHGDGRLDVGPRPNAVERGAAVRRCDRLHPSGEVHVIACAEVADGDRTAGHGAREVPRTADADVLEDGGSVALAGVRHQRHDALVEHLQPGAPRAIALRAVSDDAVERALPLLEPLHGELELGHLLPRVGDAVDQQSADGVALLQLGVELLEEVLQLRRRPRVEVYWHFEQPIGGDTAALDEVLPVLRSLLSRGLVDLQQHADAGDVRAGVGAVALPVVGHKHVVDPVSHLAAIAASVREAAPEPDIRWGLLSLELLVHLLQLGDDAGRTQGRAAIWDAPRSCQVKAKL
mmetsp:Transcript_41894/g.99418  ORF Transcript_41894/g.99418 Transcript_41894/m.99418 type:complete len:317 (-) Transcript_41894:394-1344(-)